MSKYIKRHGDTDGVGTRILGNLTDLMKIERDAILLPLPSSSLRVVEQYIGFHRTQSEYGGDWAMATFIEAIETEDQLKRDALILAKYNEEDLEAMWAVFQWLRSKAPAHQAAHLQ